MKQRAKLSKALLLSFILHLVFMTILGVVQMRPQKAGNELYIQVEIISQPRKPAPKVLKRPLYLSSVSNLLTPQSQQIIARNPVLRPPRLQISSFLLPGLPTERSFSMLTEESIPLSTTSNSVSDTSFPPSDSQISRGRVGASNGFAFGNQVGRPPQSLGLESQTVLPEITSLTQLDLALVKIGRHLLLTRESDTIDIVFLIDASKSMRNDIDAVRNHLNQMTDLLKTEGLDFTVGLVAFRDGTTFSLLGWNFQVTPQTTAIRQIKKTLNSIRCRGGEKALDALVRAANEVKFRRGAERRFILVTDEYVSGSYSPKKVLTKIKSEKISVNVIGRDEHFQKLLAEGTGGLWLPISSLKE